MKFKDLKVGDKFRRVNRHTVVKRLGICGIRRQMDLYNLIYTKTIKYSCGNTSSNTGGYLTIPDDYTVYKIEKQKTKIQQKEKFGTLKLTALK